MRRLLALGVPAATQMTLEVGVFAAATALAGRLAPIALAAHQIAHQHRGDVTFMVPLGVASAGAVRVGHARRAAAIRRRGTCGLDRAPLGAGFMSCTAAAFVLIPQDADRRVHPR